MIRFEIKEDVGLLLAILKSFQYSYRKMVFQGRLLIKGLEFSPFIKHIGENFDELYSLKL